MARGGTSLVPGCWWIAFVYLRDQSMTYSIKLNGPQLSAVQATEGPLLILAGPVPAKRGPSRAG
jgi:hypothetical protein